MSTATVARIAVLGLLLGSGGCVVSPYDSQVVDSQSDVAFGGASAGPGHKIEIQACYRPSPLVTHSCPSGFRTIATTTSGTASSYTDSFGGHWYPWEVFIAIPSDYWISHAAQPVGPNNLAAATVRILDNGDATYYYQNDPNDCPLPWGYAQLDTNNPLCAISPAPVKNNSGLIVFARGP